MYYIFQFFSKKSVFSGKRDIHITGVFSLSDGYFLFKLIK